MLNINLKNKRGVFVEKKLVSKDVKEVISYLEDARNRISYCEQIGSLELDLIDASIKSLKGIGKDVELLEKGYHIKMDITIDEAKREITLFKEDIQRAYEVASEECVNRPVRNHLEIALKEVSVILDKLSLIDNNAGEKFVYEYLLSAFKNLRKCITKTLTSVKLSNYEDETIEKVKCIDNNIDEKIKKLEIFIKMKDFNKI